MLLFGKGSFFGPLPILTLVTIWWFEELKRWEVTRLVRKVGHTCTYTEIDHVFIFIYIYSMIFMWYNII